jgi:hypothetical protein
MRSMHPSQLLPDVWGAGAGQDGRRGRGVEGCMGTEQDGGEARRGRLFGGRAGWEERQGRKDGTVMVEAGGDDLG